MDAIVPTFDYNRTAELYSASPKKSARNSLTYMRFAQAAEAIRFAIEELPPSALVGAYLEIDEERYGRQAIHRLYDSADFPLAPRAAASSR